MSAPPANPKIYHITHVENLASMLALGCISSDARRIRQSLENTNVGMAQIKARRLALEVDCHPGTRVGEYVPFYFCPRSIMLYLLYRGNHPDLSYRGAVNGLLCILKQTCIPWSNGLRVTTTAGHSAKAMLVRITRVSSRILRNLTKSTGRQSQHRTFVLWPSTKVNKPNFCCSTHVPGTSSSALVSSTHKSNSESWQ